MYFSRIKPGVIVRGEDAGRLSLLTSENGYNASPLTISPQRKSERSDINPLLTNIIQSF